MKKIVTIVTIIMFTFFLHSQTRQTNHNNFFKFGKVTKVNIDNQGPNVDSFIGGEIFLELDFELWQNKTCPGCEITLILGLNDEPIGCLYSGSPGKNGYKQSIAQYITVPKIDGKYNLSINRFYSTKCEEAMRLYPLKETLYTIGSINVNSTASKQISDNLKKYELLIEQMRDQRPQYEMQRYDNMTEQLMSKSANNFAPRDATIGLAVGGSKNIQNFRNNLKRKYLPLFTDMTYEGLYYDYYFETGDTGSCDDLFCPSYVSTISKDPLNNKNEYFISVGLNSGLKKSDFKRKKLNLIVVLDVSGSMESSFNKYHYDNNQRIAIKDTRNKIDIAKETISLMLNHLNNDDNFGLVTFNNSSRIIEPLNRINNNIEALQNKIKSIRAGGGTDLSAGMYTGTQLLNSLEEFDPDEYETRIIYLTDLMINSGNTDSNDLFSTFKKNADNKIYTTFIGMGVDFNTQLVEKILNVKGANYFSVHSGEQFKTKLNDEFDFMVTPLAFNVQLSLSSEGYKIKNVYGSPEGKFSSDEILKINTLFPSKNENGKVKGGLVLLELEKTSDNPELTLRVSYEDRNSNFDVTEEKVNFKTRRNWFFGMPEINSGLHKGILLARYANVMKNWVNFERENLGKNNSRFNSNINVYNFCPNDGYNNRQGSTVCPKCKHCLLKNITLAQNKNPEHNIKTYFSQYPIKKTGYNNTNYERRSNKLVVSDEIKPTLVAFYDYFKNEAVHLNDSTLNQELDILQSLIKYNENSYLTDMNWCNSCEKKH